MVALVIWRMKMAGEISGFAPQTHREKVRLYWLIVGVVNFLAFLAHIGFDHGGIAFPAGGRLVGGVYLVTRSTAEIFRLLRPDIVSAFGTASFLSSCI